MKEPIKTKYDLLGTAATINVPSTEVEIMAYVAFEVCTVPVGGHPKRGAKAKCGYCDRSESIQVNTVRSHGDDDEQVERSVANKFEKLGWKIGKTSSQHRCPGCFAALKTAARKRNGIADPDNKVVPITPIEPPKLVEPTPVVVEVPGTPPPRRPSRDERRIIHNKIDEKYVSEAVGYTAGWSDQKVADDLGVPVAWVAEIRDENFGPNIDEVMASTVADAKGLLDELKASRYSAEPILAALNALDERAAKIELILKTIAERK
jgi:hypothetical protein